VESPDLRVMSPSLEQGNSLGNCRSEVTAAINGLGSRYSRWAFDTPVDVTQGTNHCGPRGLHDVAHGHLDITGTFGHGGG
jgi:hypothetical protein